MSRTKKTPKDIRQEAAAIVRWAMIERQQTGDPEGAEVFRDVLQEIQRIRLTEDSQL